MTKEILSTQSAMEGFIAQAPDFRNPVLVAKIKDMPTLPDLKAQAQARQAEGLPTVDQSAGDIAAVGQPLNPDFLEYIDEVREKIVDQQGKPIFPQDPGEIDGFPGKYQMVYQGAVEMLAGSWGINGRVLGVQTMSGRNALAMHFHALKQRALALQKDGKLNKGQFAIVLDPYAWSGYQPLAMDLDIALINSPTSDGNSLGQSAEGLKEGLKFARSQGLVPIGAISVVPSNPTGLGIKPQELAKITGVAAHNNLPMLIDAFYSPLDERGHNKALGMPYLEKELPPEILRYLGLLVGETKITHSQTKTGTLIHMAPEGHDKLARQLMTLEKKRMSATNTYPTPRAALTSFALHQYPGGIHKAMGPRWDALVAARNGIRQTFDDLQLPLTIGGSFYGVGALVSGDGNSLIRDTEGRPITDPVQTVKELTSQHGLVGAPGITFRSSPSAAKTVRLTATASEQELAKLKNIIEGMLEIACRHG